MLKHLLVSFFGPPSKTLKAKTHGLPAFSAFNPRAVSLAEGLRAALSVAAIVAVDEWMHWPLLMEAALAAWLTCLCDAGGPIRKRVPFLVAFGLAGAVVTAGLGWLAGVATLPVVVAVSSAGVFCALMLRVYGQAQMLVGNLLTVVLVLALTRDLSDWRAAGATGLVFLAGSAWALLLTMAIWRLHPYLPARQSVAQCWRALARLTADLRNLLREEAPDEAEWDRHAREHRREVRTAIEAARATVLAAERERGPMSERAAHAWIRLEAAEQIFGGVIALADVLEHEKRPEVRAAADRMLRRLRPVLLLLADWMVTDAAQRPARVEKAADWIGACAAGLTDNPVRSIARHIAERLRIAMTLASADAAAPAAPPLSQAAWRARVLGPLRANLDWSSAALRHALRGALAAAVGVAVTLAWPTSYDYWLTITLVLTMQPYFALTITRAVERIGGTVLGGMVGAAIATVCTTPLAMAAVLFPLTVLALAVRGVNFGLFMACITPVVMLLVEVARPGQSQVEIALLRALYTVGGGVLALAFNALLWPVWEPERLRAELRAAIVAHGRYACTEIAALLGEADAAAVEQARRAAGVASNNAEASLQRVLLEPARSDTARLQAALTIDAALRRMAGRVAALQVDAVAHPRESAAWEAWRAWIEDSAARLAAGAAALAERPPLPQGDPDGESLARIARQMELAAGALGRLGYPSAA